MERIVAAILAGTVVLSLGGAAMADQREEGRMGQGGHGMSGHGMGGHGMGDDGMDHQGMGDRSMGPRIDFDVVDADKDGKITPAEIAASRAARFAAADTNKDGKLDRAELAAQAQQMMAERMATRALDMLDADRDGALSAEEMADGPGFGARMFTRLDADKDGALTRDVVNAARDAMGQRGGNAKRGDDRKDD